MNKKKIKMEKLIEADLENSSSDESDSESDDEKMINLTNNLLKAKKII